jgi:hypothetical protein
MLGDHETSLQCLRSAEQIAQRHASFAAVRRSLVSQIAVHTAQGDEAGRAQAILRLRALRA